MRAKFTNGHSSAWATGEETSPCRTTQDRVRKRAVGEAFSVREARPKDVGVVSSAYAGLASLRRFTAE